MTLLKLFESLNTEDLFTFFKKQDYVTLYLKENDFVVLRTPNFNWRSKKSLSLNFLKQFRIITLD